MSKFSYHNIESALILGGGDIGQALCLEILNRKPQCHIFITTRNEISSLKSHPSANQITQIIFNLGDSNSWQELSEQLGSQTSTLDLIISTWGFLHDHDHKPEKSLRDINLKTIEKTFMINAFAAPLAAQVLEPFLSKTKPSVFSFLSAKVGSISDNHLGGWYSYRASKAALNMFLKTVSIEWQRKKIPVSVMAIHPGTTKTRLSKPYLKHFNLKVWETNDTAKHLCDVIEKSYSQGTGLFKNWDLSDLPW